MKLKGALKNVPKTITDKYSFVVLDLKPTEGFWLNFKNEELFIEFADQWSDIRLDFVETFSRFKQGKQKPFSNLLKKVFGKPKEIIDLTCGFAEDSLILVFFGHKVISLERNPVMAALLENALSRARNDDEFGELFKSSLDIKFCSASKFIEENDLSNKWLYFDPMFGDQSGKKSLSSKRMQFLSQFAGSDEDWKSVFNSCLQSKAKSLIFKHSNKAPMPEIKPNEVIMGKTVRFDKHLCGKNS